MDSSSASLRQLCQQINALRVENADAHHFIPEPALAHEVTNERIAQIVSSFVAIDSRDEVVSFVTSGARKIFSILAQINHVGHIRQFIHKDQMQTRPMDSLLPLDKNALRNILEDENVAARFYKEQWEFCAPVFPRGQLYPREFDLPTILPFLTESPLGRGGYGAVYKITIHPCHRPGGCEAMTDFVRKELEMDDSTYLNEVRVLSTLHRLNHPNILRLLACYTHKGKHNLVFPYIAGGTLRDFLGREQTGELTSEQMFYLLSGLASAVWALHEIANENSVASRKGQHQDLRPANVLYDGHRFILADFGLSSVKSIEEPSNTPFKGRTDFYQAPECASLEPPYQEYETTRATDIWALGCIIADMIVYFVRGPAGVQEFVERRKFYKPPIHYRLYHKHNAPNEAVAAYLNETAQQYGQASLAGITKLVAEMLDLSPSRRPSARTVIARLYTITTAAFAEQITRDFAEIMRSPDAVVEQARFVSWRRSFEASYYLTLPATATAATFDQIIDTLRQIGRKLKAIDRVAPDLDSRAFLEVRQLNTNLLQMLPESGRLTARTQLDTIILKSMTSDQADPVYNTLRSAFSGTAVITMADTKLMVAQVEDGAEPSAVHSWVLIPGPFNLRLSYIRGTGRHRLARVYDSARKETTTVLEETIQYQDQLRRQKLEPRVHGLCNLLSCSSLAAELSVPPFYGLHDDRASFSFGLLYNLPDPKHGTEHASVPQNLYEVLAERQPSSRPSLELRLKLALKLAESLAAFHDVDWYHKDLTSRSVLFFPFPAATFQWISQPYLVGFQHSRSATEDFSEGPIQDRNHRRYHDPSYLSMENRQFKDFRPEYDYYSLGILLLEIGTWDTIDMIMRDYADEDNHAFSRILLSSQLTQLQFSMGSKYVAAIQRCLTGLSEGVLEAREGVPQNAQMNLLFKESVIAPLKLLDGLFSVDEGPNSRQKRKRTEENDNATVPFVKKRTQL